MIEQEAQQDGWYLLHTNQSVEACPAEQVLGHYKGLWEVEEAFCELKSYLEILNLVESPYFNCNPDTGNVFLAGQDPYAYLEAIAKRENITTEDFPSVVIWGSLRAAK